MSHRGTAFLALWNDFDPAMQEEYECWHTFEHVPERLSSPGFVQARRYAANNRKDHRYFTLYELENLDALATTAYQELIDSPTSWSAEMRKSFHDFLRFPCEPVATEGMGMGGVLGTFVFSLDGDASEVPSMLTAELHRLLAQGSIAIFRVGVTRGNPGYKVFQQSFDGTADSTVFTVIVEGTSSALLDECGVQLSTKLDEQFPSLKKLRWETFDFLYAISKAELLAAKASRLPPREDLRRVFHPA
ncbi:MAG: hypothetical protein ACRECW_05485 [Phyllobacterium sp.]